jgi:hypothetical protein
VKRVFFGWRKEPLDRLSAECVAEEMGCGGAIPAGTSHASSSPWSHGATFCDDMVAMVGGGRERS